MRVPAGVRGALTAIGSVGLVVLLSVCTGDTHTITSPQTRSTPRVPFASMAVVPVSTTVLIGGGNIATCSGNDDEKTAGILDTVPGTIFTTGNAAYPNGTDAAYSSCFNPSTTWGRHKARILPAPGDQDYKTANATGYYNYFGAAAGDPTKGYYSYDIGTWHLIALNSNCGYVACKAGSAQETWLANDLATHPNRCTLAYFHHPLFSAGPTTHSAVKPFWNDLYAAHADVVLNGHKHNYERLTKLNPSGAPVADGIRKIIAGTGGENHSISATLYPGTKASDGGHFGILEMTLHPAGYDWQFVSDTGSVIDGGSDACVT